MTGPFDRAKVPTAGSSPCLEQAWLCNQLGAFHNQRLRAGLDYATTARHLAARLAIPLLSPQAEAGIPGFRNEGKVESRVSRVTGIAERS